MSERPTESDDQSTRTPFRAPAHVTVHVTGGRIAHAVFRMEEEEEDETDETSSNVSLAEGGTGPWLGEDDEDSDVTSTAGLDGAADQHDPWDLLPPV